MANLVLYNHTFEFHFYANLEPLEVAGFLNKIPSLGFRFREGKDNFILDPERTPGIFWLHRKQYPTEERPIPSSQANYYIKLTARASEGDILEIARQLARQLTFELETEVWLVDGQARKLRPFLNFEDVA
jgi:hypothetical protein